MYMGVEHAERANLYYNFGEQSEEINVCDPGWSNRAKMLWKMNAAKERREDYYDPEQKSMNRNVVRQELWVNRLQSPVLD